MNRALVTLMLLLLLLSSAVAQTTAAAVVKLEGQVVCCEDCWAEADRKTVPYGTEENLEKAKQCVANGDPTLLAVENQGGWKFYELETGKYKRPGKNWLSFVGKYIAVTGTVRTKGKRDTFKVDTLTVVSEPKVAPSAPPESIIGTEVALTLKDLVGSDQSLSSYKGRIVVLNFWATYCVPCRKEMPDLARVQNEYAAFGVQVIGAAADPFEDQPKVRQFIKETKVNFPVWLGASAADMKKFGLGAALPGTVIIGRDGKVVAQLRGIIKEADLRKHLQTLVAKDESGVKGQIASAGKKAEAGKSSSVPS
jgi:cytochrome c biogenesis protein CcmG/thiol:disulfide interchange protein DsbE